MIPTNGEITEGKLPLNQARVCLQTHLTVESAELDPHFSGLLALWKSLNTSDALPRKQDFSPFSIGPKLLPYILIIDVLHDPLRFKYRLTGTRLDRIHNTNLTGTFVSDLQPEEVRIDLENNLTEMLDTKQPQFVQLEFTNRADNHRNFKVLRLPMQSDTDDENRIDHVLVLTDAE